MIQEDYIVREVNRFTKILFELFLNKEHQKYEESVKLIDKELIALTGFDLNSFLMVSPDHIIKMYSSNNLSLEHIKFISDMLFYAKEIKGFNKLSIIRRLVRYYLFLNSHDLKCTESLKKCIQVSGLSNISKEDWESIIQVFIDNDDTVFAEKLIDDSISLEPDEQMMSKFTKNFFFSP